MRRDTRRTLKLALLSVLFAAGAVSCSDDGTRNFGPVTPTPGGSHLSPTTLSCTATLHPMNAVCRPVGGGVGSVDSRLRRYIVVGKQGVYVNLALSNFAYSTTTNVFSFSATVQNLMTQPIGTQNGSTLAGTGVDVFFTAGPSSESGSGTVTPIGTSTGTFTASGQKYYEYAEIIKPDSTSPALTWSFQLSSGVTSFNFFVEVAGDLPAEGSILRWTPIHQGVTSNELTSVWAANASNVFAVGLNGTVLYYNGTTWSQLLTATGYNARSVSGSSATDVWVVADAGVTGHYNGSTFTNVSTGGTTNLKGVYEISSTNIWAVGGASVVYQSTNGTSWTSIAVPHGTDDSLRAVWAANATNIFVVGDNGRGMIWNGTAWTQITKPAGDPNFRGVWGTSATNVFAVTTAGSIYQFTGGTTWTQMTSPTTNELDAIGGTSGTNIWAVGYDGTTINYNGTTWSVVGPAVGLNLHGVTSGITPAWAVGDAGTLVQLNGTTETLSSQSGFPIYRIWAASDTSVWATSIGTILHYNGSTWSVVYVSATASDTMLGLWGFSPADVHTLSVNGNVDKWNGTTWTPSYHGGVSWRAEWGDEADTNVLCAASETGTVYCNDIGNNEQAGTAQLMSMWGPTNDIIYTSNVNGAIYQSTDSGATFNAMTSGTTDTLFAIWGASTTAIWAVGQAGTIVANTGTATWTAQTSGTTNDLRWLWADSPPTGYTGDVYAVGDLGTIQHYNGTQWSSMWSGVTSTLRCVYGTSATNVYIAGDNGVALVGSQ